MQAGYNYASAFSIDPRNGQISVNEPLAYNSAAVIILTVKVTDKNAEGEKEQTDTGETILRDKKSNIAKYKKENTVNN